MSEIGVVDIAALQKLFENSLADDEDINLDSYLKAYKELAKLCTLLGSIFDLVGGEIQSKSEILLKLMNASPSEFETVKLMVQYERGNNLLRKNEYVSGCRTLLRLHWGLDFVRNFLQGIYDLDANGSTVAVGREVYDRTLSPHHVWYVRLGAKCAINFLPSKGDLVNKLCNGQEHAVMNQIPGMLKMASLVYSRVQNIYETERLLDLE